MKWESWIKRSGNSVSTPTSTSNFRLWKDTVSFIARGSISNTLPAFYMRHYHSKYFYWDNDNMEKEFRTRLEGELNIEHWQTNLESRSGKHQELYVFQSKSIAPTEWR
ncbi:putative porin [Bacteroides fragilis]|nr:putative porin [Bacteroides fragilis]